ncbi:hypothetical protein ACIOGX_07615 [Streptomyces sp. NPDC088147]|uniref:hypothetical protein n=1 Tax=Streptomyces sp. NPDC088147 TaxID=3365830 RepID=UPI00381FE8A1
MRAASIATSISTVHQQPPFDAQAASSAAQSDNSDAYCYPPGDPRPHRPLARQRAELNWTAQQRPGGPLHVVLYALTVAGQEPHDDLAGQGCAAQHTLTVADRIVGNRRDGDDQRGAARLRPRTAPPADQTSPVRGVVAVSTGLGVPHRPNRRDAAALDRRPAGGLWLVRGETEI